MCPFYLNLCWIIDTSKEPKKTKTYILTLMLVKTVTTNTVQI